jgi:hypothetical protein
LPPPISRAFQFCIDVVAGSENRIWTLISFVCTRASLVEGFGREWAKPEVMQILARLWRETLRYFGVAPYPHERP